MPPRKARDTRNFPLYVQYKNRNGVTTAFQEHYYDPAGNRIQTIDSIFIDGKYQKSITTTFEYNSVNQIIRQVEGKKTTKQKINTFEYNVYGQKSFQTKCDGTKLHFEYDALGRLKHYYASDRSFEYTYYYDKHNHLYEVYDSIRQTTTKRTYTPAGELLSELQDNNISVSYTYDKIGRMTGMTLPDTSKIVYTYDPAFLRNISRFKADGTLIYEHKYLDYDLSGTHHHTQLCASAGHLKIETNKLKQPTTISTSEFTQTVTYNTVGNLESKSTESHLGILHNNYQYDDLYQLTSEKEHHYHYDSLYNRIQKDDESYSLNDLNQLIQKSHCHYDYDDNGNLIRKTENGQSVEYKYDALDRLIEVIDGNDHTYYTYDAFNRRMSKKTNSTTENYIYQGQNEVGSTINGEIVTLRILGKGLGAEIGAAVALELNHETYIPIHDIHGNIASLLNSSGNTIETYLYTAFGEEQIYDSYGNQLLKSTVSNLWRFSSKRHDSETGFIYFGRRYYSPNIGRWVTPDPIGFDAGPNLYAYVNNNPLTRIDPYGLVPGDGYRQSCEAPIRHAARNSLFREPSGKDRNPMSEQRYKVHKDPLTGGITISIPIFRQKQISSELVDMFDDDYSDHQVIRHREYGIGIAIGVAAVATVVVVSNYGIASTLGCMWRGFVTLKKLYDVFKKQESVNFGANTKQEFSTFQSIWSPAKTKSYFQNKSNRIQELERRVSEWLGQGVRVIKNENNDMILLSRDGTKKVRFDLIKPDPHNSPHMHVEELIQGRWKGSRIYPNNVPHH